MHFRRYILFSLVLLLLVGGSFTAFSEETAGDQNWPCDQILVPEISLTAVWSGPAIDKEIKDWWKDEEVYNIVEELNEAILTEEEVTAIIDQFVSKASGNKKKKLLLVFAGFFEKMKTLRRIHIKGIKRCVERQREITGSISDASGEIRKLRTGKADTARLYQDPEMLEQSKKLEWNARVHDERARLTPYICDEPVLALERLAIRSRIILKHLQ